MSKRRKAVDYGAELENLYKRWDYLYEHGGSDPFWSDGVNANMVKNQIIYCKNKIENENSLFLLPDAYYREIPPGLPNDYMLDPMKFGKTLERLWRLLMRTKTLNSFVSSQKVFPKKS